MVWAGVGPGNGQGRGHRRVTVAANLRASSRTNPRRLRVVAGTLSGMAYDEELAHRLREALQDESELTEQRMFGGLAFMLGGHMAVAASGRGGILLRIDPARADELVDGKAARRFEMRGRAMNGWLDLDPAAVATDESLRQWVAHGVRYARSLPPK